MCIVTTETHWKHAKLNRINFRVPLGRIGCCEAVLINKEPVRVRVQHKSLKPPIVLTYSVETGISIASDDLKATIGDFH